MNNPALNSHHEGQRGHKENTSGKRDINYLVLQLRDLRGKIPAIYKDKPLKIPFRVRSSKYGPAIAFAGSFQSRMRSTGHPPGNHENCPD